MNENKFKELNIPYIGIKVESIPTILRILGNSSSNTDFINYYLETGKKTKTITEYLASLRNLKLAEKEKDKQTRLNNNGKKLLLNDIDLIYQNLLGHCLKNFPDLKIIKDIIKSHNPTTVKELINGLNKKGYKIKRTQTLSSYFKFFKETDLRIETIKKPHINKNEDIEYQQFYKFILVLAKKKNSNYIDILDFNLYLQEEKICNKKITEEYMKLLNIDNKIRLYQIDNKLKSKESYIEIDKKFYYYFEVL